MLLKVTSWGATLEFNIMELIRKKLIISKAYLSFGEIFQSWIFFILIHVLVEARKQSFHI